MSRLAILLLSAALLPCFAVAQDAPAAGPYKVLKTITVGGEGGFDYVVADSSARRLYVARSGAAGSLHVYDLDTLTQVGEIPHVSAHGAVVDDATGHGFATSKPVTMFDAKTLAVIKTIDTKGDPDGFLLDAAEHRVYILSHETPNVTVLDTKDGTMLGTIELGDGPEESALDGHGKMFLDLEDKGTIAVVDTKTMKMIATYDIAGQGGGTGCAGLAYDSRNKLLFAACREKKLMNVVDATTGKLLGSIPNGAGTDGVVYSAKTGEIFSSQGDGTLTVFKAESAKKFGLVQTVATPVRAKTLALDEKTGNLLLITAKFGTAPAGNGPNGRPARPPMVPGTFEIVVVGK